MSKAASRASASNGSQRATQKSAYEEAADWPTRLRNAKDRKTEYLTYLDSVLWSKKRIAALERAGGRCQLCNSKKRLSVHHRTYEHIGEEPPEDLTVLCRKCHAMFHDNRGLSGQTSKPKKKKPPKRAKARKAKKKRPKLPQSVEYPHRDSIRYQVLRSQCPSCNAPVGVNCREVRPGWMHRERILKVST